MGTWSREGPRPLNLLHFLNDSTELIIILSLFPDEDVLTKEIVLWKGFAVSLPEKEKETFTQMLNDCYKYSIAINAKGIPFPTEPMIMALLFSQHKLIEWLETKIAGRRHAP